MESLLSIPRIEALALPIVVEQTTLEPTPIEYCTPMPYRCRLCVLLISKGMRIHTSRGRLRCFVQDNNFIVDLLDVRYVREQSFVNAFLCSDSLPTSYGHAFMPHKQLPVIPMLPASVCITISGSSSLGSA